MRKFESFLEEKSQEQSYNYLVLQIAEMMVIHDVDSEEFKHCYLEAQNNPSALQRFVVKDRNGNVIGKVRAANAEQAQKILKSKGYGAKLAQPQPQQPQQSSWMQKAASLAGRGLNKAASLAGQAPSLAGRGLGAAGGAALGGLAGGPLGALAGGAAGWKYGGQKGDKISRSMNYNDADEVRKLDVAKRAIHDLIQAQMAYTEKNPQLKGYFEPKIQELQKVQNYLDSGLKGNMGDQFADYWTSGIPFTHDNMHAMMTGQHPMSALNRYNYGGQNLPYGYHSQFNNPYPSMSPEDMEAAVNAAAAPFKKQRTNQANQANQVGQTQQTSQFGQSVDTNQMTGNRTPDFNGNVTTQDGSQYVQPPSWPTNPGDDVSNTATENPSQYTHSTVAAPTPLRKKVATESFSEWFKKRDKN